VRELASHFLARFARLRTGAPLTGIAADAMDALSAWRWPGNVRELEHAIERAVVLAEGPEILEEDLPETVRNRPISPPAVELPDGSLSLDRAKRALEDRIIRAALDRTAGNRTRAAELLGISYRALLYKIKEYGIDA
jgi:two-component system response regulator AtoC